MTTALLCIGIVQTIVIADLVRRWLHERELHRLYKDAYERACDYSDRWRDEAFRALEHPPVHINAQGVSGVRASDVLASRAGRREIERTANANFTRRGERMTEEQIEQEARALCRRRGFDPDEVIRDVRDTARGWKSYGPVPRWEITARELTGAHTSAGPRPEGEIDG